METVTYLLASMLAVCGTIAGIIVGGMARRELSDGERYLRALHDLLLCAALLAAMNAISIPLPASALASVSLLLALRYTSLAPASLVTALGTGLMLWSAGSTESLTLLSSLLFLAGLPRGSLMAKRIVRRETSRWLIVAALAAALGALF